MDAALRIGSGAVVFGLAVPPAIEVAAIGQEGQRALAAGILGLALVAGTHGVLRRRPAGGRTASAIYGVFAIGLGLFATIRPIPQLLAYVVALVGMNVLLQVLGTYGPVLAAVKEEDELSRRTRLVALRSLGVSGALLAIAYGGSLALLPAFAIEVGSRDPLVALVLAGALVGILLALAALPAIPTLRRSARPR